MREAKEAEEKEAILFWDVLIRVSYFAGGYFRGDKVRKKLRRHPAKSSIFRQPHFDRSHPLPSNEFQGFRF
jgi:hypothetical protein